MDQNVLIILCVYLTQADQYDEGFFLLCDGILNKSFFHLKTTLGILCTEKENTFGPFYFCIFFRKE